jgi:hypothetical protein
MWRLRSSARFSTSQNGGWRQSPSFWMKFSRHKWSRFSATW